MTGSLRRIRPSQAGLDVIFPAALFHVLFTPFLPRLITPFRLGRRIINMQNAILLLPRPRSRKGLPEAGAEVLHFALPRHKYQDAPRRQLPMYLAGLHTPPDKRA